MTTEATPRPWVSHEGQQGEAPVHIESPDASANGGWAVCDLWGPDAEANAEFIIRLANTIDILNGNVTRLTTQLNDLQLVATALRNRYDDDQRVKAELVAALKAALEWAACDEETWQAGWTPMAEKALKGAAQQGLED